MDPYLYKTTTVSRGLTYRYYYSPARDGKPTLLFIHGFPSSSDDWNRQVAHLQPKGYGVVVPDCLGAGGTAKPTDPAAFRFALIARDMVDILDAEGLQQVVGIGHDWGSVALSRLANLYVDRFHAFAWLALSYFPPSVVARDIDEAIVQSRAATGNDRYGYWKFFSQDDAYLKCEKNIDSFLQLIYPATPELWEEWLLPVGKAEEWVEANRTPGVPQWLSQEEYDAKREILVKAGLKSPFNYYNAAIGHVNVPDDQQIPVEMYTIHKPALYIGTTRDFGTAVCKPIMEKFVPGSKVVELYAGHWVQMEATERVNAELDTWLESLELAA
ncbi:alpha/beta-hydrolase [Trametes elegans]|nr:alpha/beta-hydrolase [Trametes elegans]